MNNNEKSFTIGVIVNNYPGVLNRISGLFSKRCYNIDSLAVGETEDPSYSRITIVCHGDDMVKNQVIRQLNKLHDVKEAKILDADSSIIVEHLLVKIDTSHGSNAEFSAIVNEFGGRIMDFSDAFITAEITGDPTKTTEFIKRCENSIIELVRSGAIAISHGAEYSLSIKWDAEE